MSWAIWTPKNKKTLEYHSCKKKHVLHLPLSMKSTTSTMFFSSNPRVVRAGVPIRIPPGFNAEVSPGKQEVWKPRAAGKQDASSHLEPCFYLLKCCRVLKPFQLLLHSVPKRNYGGQKEAESLTFKKTLGRTSAKIRWLSVPPDTSCEQCNIETLNSKSDQELEIERLYFVITLGHFRCEHLTVTEDLFLVINIIRRQSLQKNRARIFMNRRKFVMATCFNATERAEIVWLCGPPWCPN